jgi:hypothetical protein
MKHDDKNALDIEERLYDSLQGPPQEALEVDCERVRTRLRETTFFRRTSRAEARGWRRLAILPAAAAVILAVFFGVAPDGEEGTVQILADGSRVEMRSGAEVSVEPVSDGLRVLLKSGSIIVNAASQAPSRHLYVATRDVTVSVVGTVFLVKADDSGSHVAVIEGEVRVQQGGTEKKLLPGEQASSSPKLEAVALPAEIGWSREAAAHLALLHQSISGLSAGSSQVPGLVQGNAGGTLEGVVMREGTDTPIAGARVYLAPGAFESLRSLFANPPATFPSTVADSRGRFSFVNLAPRGYLLFAAADGYITREFGQSPKGVAGIAVNVLSGQTTRDLSVWLSPAASISGRILDPNTRNPVPSIPVYLVRQRYDAVGTKGFAPVRKTTTNDRGEYRLIGLAHGRYHVMAGTEQPHGAEFAGVNQLQTSPYGLTYYPGSTELDLAVRVVVEPGAEVAGIEFPLKERVRRKVRGRVVGLDGRPVDAARLQIAPLPLGGEPTTINRNVTQFYRSADGTFELLDLEPRKYRLEASHPATAPGPVGSRSAVSAIVDLERRDVDDLVFRLPVEFGMISGRFITEAGVSKDWTKSNVVLRPQNGDRAVPVIPTTAGVFEANIKAGDYRVAFAGTLPEGSYIKDMQLDGISVLSRTFTISPNYRGQLDISIGRNGAQVQGTVLNDQRRLVPAVLVALIPKPRENRTEQYLSVVSGQAGRFEFRGVRPGTYTVMAWEEAEPSSYFDPLFLDAAEPGSPQVTVREGESTSVDVKVTRLK